MAKATCSITLKGFKWDRWGYADLMDEPGVQSIVERKAEAVRSVADADLKAPGHRVKRFDGRLAKGYVVDARSFEAKYAQAKRKTLSKAFNSLGGGG